MSGTGEAIARVAGRTALALFVAFAVGGIVIAVNKKSPSAVLPAFQALFAGAFGSPFAISNTLKAAIPILLTGLAVSVALAAGLFNIGAEGQLAVGGLAAAVCGAHLGFLPPWLLLLVSMLVGMLAGGLWAFLPGWLKVRRGAHEVITAILLNYVAQNLTRYLASVPLRDPVSQSPQTRDVLATLPRFFGTYDIQFGLLIAVSVSVALWFLLWWTVWGFEIRAVGLGASAARASGIPVGRVQIQAMLVSGALAGLAGAVLVLSATPFRHFPADFYGAGYGFDGLAVALLAAGSPLLCIPSALLFSALSVGAAELGSTAQIPKQIAGIVQAVLIVAIAAQFGLGRLRPRKQQSTPTGASADA